LAGCELCLCRAPSCSCVDQDYQARGHSWWAYMGHLNHARISSIEARHAEAQGTAFPPLQARNHNPWSGQPGMAALMRRRRE